MINGKISDESQINGNTYKDNTSHMAENNFVQKNGEVLKQSQQQKNGQNNQGVNALVARVCL